MTGKMEAAQPVFAEPAQAVGRGRVLAGCRCCCRGGLLRLPNGFYGIAGVLPFVALLTLARAAVDTQVNA